VVLALVAALAAGGAAAARSPSPAQKAAITAALRSEQGQVAIQKILVSTANPSFAALNWGFAHGGFSALHSSLLGLTKGEWKILWTRDLAAPALGACVYAPASVARDLFHVSCPPPSVLHARMASAAEKKLILAGFRHSDLTPYAKNALSLSHVCVSRVGRRRRQLQVRQHRLHLLQALEGLEARVRVAAPAGAAAPGRGRAVAGQLRRLQPGRLQRVAPRSWWAARSSRCSGRPPAHGGCVPRRRPRRRTRPA
jgi:hypothetical protein